MKFNKEIFKIGENGEADKGILIDFFTGLKKANKFRSINRALNTLLVKTNEEPIYNALSELLKELTYNYLNNSEKSKSLKKLYNINKSFEDFLIDNILGNKIMPNNDFIVKAIEQTLGIEIVVMDFVIVDK